MRLLSRIRRADAATPRARPPSRLNRRLALAGITLVALTGSAGGAVLLVRAGYVEHAEAFFGQHLAAASRSLGFAVADVSVAGRDRVSRQAVLDALGVRRGTPIFAIDLPAAKARLEAMPWVREAEIERRLPDTIFVRIDERQPLAFWQRQGKLVLIDRDGNVVPTERLDTFGALLVLVGDDAPHLGGPLLEMLGSEPTLAPHVVAAVRVGGRRWNLRLDSGIDVALPEQDAEAAWHRLAAADRNDNLLARNIQAVDLRLPDRLVLRLPPEPPTPKKGKSPRGPT